MIFKDIYLIVLLAMIVVGFGLLNKTQGRKEELARIIRRMLWLSIFIVLVNIGILLCRDQQLATFFWATYFASTSWLIMLLIMYTEVYTGVFRRYRVAFWTYFVICVIDTMSFLVNAVTGHVFRLTEHYDLFFGNCYVLTDRSIFFILHYAWCYFMLLLVILPLVAKCKNTIGFYRRRYSYILFLVMLAVALNSLYAAVNGSVDLSVLAYGITAVVLSNMSLYYIPKTLLENAAFQVVWNMNSAVIAYDLDGNTVFVNEAAREFFHIREDIAVMNERFFTWMNEHGTEKIERTSWEEIHEEGNRIHYVDVEFNPLFDEKKNLIGSYFQLTDRTEEHERFEQEKFRATHDCMTGIYNREFFMLTVEKALKQEPDRPRVMIVSNIRDFKLINDLFGTEKGDEILKLQAGMLRTLAKEGSIYGRMEADRFALCMPKERYNEEVLTKHIKEMASMFEGTVYHMYIHCGVYEITDPREPVATICDKAYMAVRSISEEYDRIFSYYSNEMMEKTVADKRIIGEFDKALEQEQFVIYLQPQVDRYGTVKSAEALVRWNHPEKGMVFPNDFIPTFERGGLIHKLDMYVWELAVRQIRSWMDSDKDNLLSISINISPKDFLYLEVYQVITGLVEKYQIPPNRLNLEITETVLMNDTEKNMETIEKLKAYGFRIEVDDFGSGFSSLNMLKDLNADVIKIDRGFLRETQDHERSRSILNMIISLSKQLGMSVITEGVETKEQIDSLLDMGCEMFQGYYYSKPISVSEFEEKYL